MAKKGLTHVGSAQSAETVFRKMPREPPCGDCEHCRDPKVLKRKGCLTNKAAGTSARKSETQLLTVGGHGGRVRAREPAWAHEQPADTKRPRLATGAYDSLHALNRALFEATESLAAEQQTTILESWVQFGNRDVVDILLDNFTDEIKRDTTKLNSVLVQFLELVRSAGGNEIELTQDMLQAIFLQSEPPDAGASPPFFCVICLFASEAERF